MAGEAGEGAEVAVELEGWEGGVGGWVEGVDVCGVVGLACWLATGVLSSHVS